MTIFTWGRWSQPDGESVEDLKIVSYLMLPWGGVDKRERLALEINSTFINVLEVIHFFFRFKRIHPDPFLSLFPVKGFNPDIGPSAT